MNKVEITGKRLYLLYAFPCAEGRCHRGEITADDLDELTRLVKMNREPSIGFLEYCFPCSFVSFRNFYSGIYRDDPWSAESVRNFWQRCHGRSAGEPSLCKVEEAIVVKTVAGILKGGGSLSSLIFPGNHDSFFALNLYGIEIEKDEKVFLHQRVIIEKSL